MAEEHWRVYDWEKSTDRKQRESPMTWPAVSVAKVCIFVNWDVGGLLVLYVYFEN